MAKNNDDLNMVRFVTGKDCYVNERLYYAGEVVEFEEGSELHKRYSKCVWMKRLNGAAEKPTKQEAAAAARAAAEQEARLKEEANDRQRVAAGQGSAKAKADE